MKTVVINGSKVTMTESTYNKYMECVKANEKLSKATDLFQKALHSYIYDDDGCDKSDLYDYEADMNDAKQELYLAWERFCA